MASIAATFEKLKNGQVGRGMQGFRGHVAAELQPCGVAELDVVLGGGFPRGSLVELCGPATSGRTGLAFSLLAQATSRQEACAFVDVSDSLDPVSLAAAGVDLPRLLWVRCGETPGKKPAAESSFFDSPEEKEHTQKQNRKFCGGIILRAQIICQEWNSFRQPECATAWHPQNLGSVWNKRSK